MFGLFVYSLVYVSGGGRPYAWLCMRVCMSLTKGQRRARHEDSIQSRAVILASRLTAHHSRGDRQQRTEKRSGEL